MFRILNAGKTRAVCVQPDVIFFVSLWQRKNID